VKKKAYLHSPEEQRVLSLLRERFSDWQAKGNLPNMKIEPGDNTGQPIRERALT
jgi:putative DNA methylase